MQDFFEEQGRTDKGSCSTKLVADLKSTGQEVEKWKYVK